MAELLAALLHAGSLRRCAPADFDASVLRCLCTASAPPLHRLCAVSAPPLPRPCAAVAPPLHSLCSLCTASAPSLQVLQHLRSHRPLGRAAAMQASCFYVAARQAEARERERQFREAASRNEHSS
jgi:hypothetical protein